MAWDDRYRMLAEGEIIQQGDECLTDTHLGWHPAGRTVGKPAPYPYFTSHRMYRRLELPEAPADIASGEIG